MLDTCRCLEGCMLLSDVRTDGVMTLEKPPQEQE